MTQGPTGAADTPTPGATAASGGSAPGTPDGAARGPVAAPATGNRTIDHALAELSELAHLPVDQHHDRLAAAHDVLAQVLQTSRDQVQAPIPGVPGPRLP